jgi:L-lysine exporter family protein LysE/ArgO
MTPPLLAVVAGFGLGLSLIVAIGAQNAFVLRQGILREAVPTVVVICTVSDLLLIGAGVAGVGGLVQASPVAVTAVGLLGGGFLICYAALAARRALRPAALSAGAAPDSGRRVASTCLAITWLNPHVYLDTMLLIGSVAAGHGGLRWAFGVGAGAASVCWFTGLGFGARLLSGVFARPAAWRVLDAVIAAVLATLGIGLVVHTWA